MPHFILDCSEHILELKPPEEIIQAVYNTANATGLFAKGDIKIRINPYKYYRVYDKFPFLLKFSIFIRNIFNGYKDSSLVNLRQTF